MKKTILILLGVIMLFVMIISGCFGKMLIFWISFAVIIIEAIYAVAFSVKNYDWQCTKCQTVFSPSKMKVLFGINSGDIKELYCPNCKKKVWCKPVKK